ncbi:sugar phosphate nucleotidyltransferase [Paenibacillus sp. GCM10012307]|uniref:Mannose-1-phosphate guanylyltransferase n=1 Tax=Paenibacillus roseus TaxID=2798579 RepID=A0A934IY23_9BACL|nr:sugar phosphate nucleotidyltransferase [Paenibacillus roseus]MBJ6361352.1 mannose-1-phosphate guanylyltransferase [Paenibacillus roseus]
MKIILLSGGAGKRLWPLSNEERSKQYLKLLKNQTGQSISMLQNTLHELSEAGLLEHTVIASSENQLPLLQEQLGSSIPYIIEPERRDTYPAIALSTTFLHSEWNIPDDEAIIVLPVDGKADSSFYKRLSELKAAVQSGDNRIALLGVAPTYPSSKYGYIVPATDTRVQPYTIKKFVEKPDTATAIGLIEQGSLWNCGIFAFKLGYLIGKLREAGYPTDFPSLKLQYHLLPKTSFDYAVVEQEPLLGGLLYEGLWEDMGNWESISSLLSQSVYGDGILGDGCDNTHIINELDTPVIVNGVPDAVIIAGESGILVTNKRLASNIKPLVEKIKPVDTSLTAIKKLDTQYNGNGGVSVQTNRITLPEGARYACPSSPGHIQWLLAYGTGELAGTDGDKLVFTAGQTHFPSRDLYFSALENCVLIEILT